MQGIIWSLKKREILMAIKTIPKKGGTFYSLINYSFYFSTLEKRKILYTTLNIFKVCGDSFKAKGETGGDVIHKGMP